MYYLQLVRLKVGSPGSIFSTNKNLNLNVQLFLIRSALAGIIQWLFSLPSSLKTEVKRNHSFFLTFS